MEVGFGKLQENSERENMERHGEHACPENATVVQMVCCVQPRIA